MPQRARWIGAVLIALSLISCSESLVQPTRTVPLAPQGLEAVAGDAEVTLDWQEVEGASGYQIYWNTLQNEDPQDGRVIRDIEAPPYVHQGLENGRNHYYVVTALDAEGVESDPSNKVSARPAADTQPQPLEPQVPQNVSARSESGRVIISWIEHRDVERYRLYWTDDSQLDPRQGEFIDNVRPPFSHGEREAGVTYYYVLTAWIGSKESASSSRVQAQPPAVTSPPATPAGLTVEAGDASLTLSWQAVAGADNYRLYWSTESFTELSGISFVLTAATRYVHDGLSNGQNYFYRVTAVNDVGESAASEEVSAAPAGEVLQGDAARGGQLYDRWWAVKGVAEPVTEHPLWALRAQRDGEPVNQNGGADSWRCVSCHGWDYRGDQGRDNVFADTYTGFPGLLDAAAGSGAELAAFISEGETRLGPAHAFIDQLDGQDIADLVVFIQNDLALPASLWAGDAAAGGEIYGQAAKSPSGQACNEAGCHEQEGATLALRTRDATERFLHKVRYGEPGGRMPGGLAVDQSLDVLRHVWQDFGLAALTGEFDQAAYERSGQERLNQIARGGRLYDNWWLESDLSPAQGHHPLWPGLGGELKGPPTWRCRSCHGWDLRGRDGEFGTGPYFSGIRGLLNTAEQTRQTAADVFVYLKRGDLHAFGDVLGDEDLYALTRFVLFQREEAAAQRAPADVIQADDGSAIGGDLANGKLVFDTFALGRCRGCHGVNGKLKDYHDLEPFRPTGFFLDYGAKEGPWEYLHKVRFGQPGSSMPGLIQKHDLGDGAANRVGDELQSSVDVLYYSQTWLAPDLPRGGRLYDNWWREKVLNPPAVSHELWPAQKTEVSAADSWRCRSCHGPDYLGAAGEYADAAHPFHTAYPGVLLMPAKSNQEIFDYIAAGTYLNSNDHAFDTRLSARDLSDLSAFINGGDNGVTDLSSLADGDVDAGRVLYEGDTPGRCLTCHGDNGTAIPSVVLGDMARQNRAEFLHAVRFGKAGSEMKPQASGFTGLSANQAADALAYAKTFSAGSVGYASADVLRGGRLFDNWWRELGLAEPDAVNPLWTLRDPTLPAVDNNADTWRCVSCHGFNYRGTGFLAAAPLADNLIDKITLRRAELTEVELRQTLFDWISGGRFGMHNYGADQTGLSAPLPAAAAWDLVKFLLEKTTLPPSLTDPVNGADLYQGRRLAELNCQSCHGESGQLVPPDSALIALDIFQLAVDDSGRFLHRVRFSSPGSDMPAVLGVSSLGDKDILDILDFAQRQFNARP